MQPPRDDEPIRSLVTLPNGSQLELELESPGCESDKLAVCLHPWSWLGGSMDDPVIDTAALVFHKHEYHILRYNSRGVGRSRGWSSLTGFNEGKDLESVVQWALQKIPDIKSIVIMGYSHGSLIASLHPLLPPPLKVSHVLVSYPLGSRGLLTLFNSSTYDTKLQELVRNPSANVLIVYGDKDEFTSESSYKEWVEKLQQRAKSLTATKLPGGTHFWRGNANLDLQRALDQWLTG
ncbi:hypothetical protein ONZ45_g19634 [Pleurotus djamor]|nr:hypothetical protein ONZ45_g19634 [Pleurotus djamor]